MTVIPLPVRGQWAWDPRGEGRAVRVSTHAESGLLNLSIWRSSTCVGTVRLLPADAATLVRGLTDGLAELAGQGGDAPATDRRLLYDLERRLARIESRPRLWRRALLAVDAWVTTTTSSLRARRSGWPGPRQTAAWCRSPSRTAAGGTPD
jgi:hypothetical protein